MSFAAFSARLTSENCSCGDFAHSFIAFKVVKNRRKASEALQMGSVLLEPDTRKRIFNVKASAGEET